MGNNLSLGQLEHIAEKFFQRFHVLIFFVLSLGGLIVATILLYGLVTRSSTAGEVTASGATFNQATIKKLNQLQTSDATVAPENVPKAKRNPFTE